MDRVSQPEGLKLAVPNKCESWSRADTVAPETARFAPVIWKETMTTEAFRPPAQAGESARAHTSSLREKPC
ncbi:MAG: hypothetical protein KAI25_00745, partial [Hyphomicrobiaceae bacterium]|nr:hypothetical protein [Hyphomicrobiaceae bacterium]